MTNAVAFRTKKTVVLGSNTVVFGTNTLVFGTNSLVFGAKNSGIWDT